MTLVIHHPLCRSAERSYIYDVVFREWLGLDYVSLPEDRGDVAISLHSNHEQGVVFVNDSLFLMDDSAWLAAGSLPTSPLGLWQDDRGLGCDGITWPLPVLYGCPLEDGSYLHHRDSVIRLGLDIFGSAFFMLTRYEELVIQDRDEHDRFAAAASIALREGFLHRPIVDEYVEILWASMKALWPRLERKQHKYQFFLSADVDHPSSNTYGSYRKALRRAAGDIVRGRGVRMAVDRFRTAALNARGDYSTDPHNVFDFMMDTAEQHGTRAAFYFIAGHSGGAIDGDYTLQMPWIRQLMRRIHDRGHEIGLHPSFNTYLDKQQLKREFDNLLSTSEALGIRQDCWGGRQHYLRWRAPDTWQHWDDVGLNYDTTVGFADHVGFRAGTCREFPVFNVETHSLH